MKKILESPFFNVMAFSLSWSLSIFFSKLLINSGIEPFRVLIQSYIVALIITTVYVFATQRYRFKELDTKVLSGLLIASGLHSGLGGFFNNLGLSLTSAVNAGFLVKFALVWTILFAWPILGEKITINKIIASIVMIIGSYFISTNGHVIVPQIGDVLIIFATLCWAMGNIMTRKILKNSTVSGDMVSFLRPVAALPLLLLVFAFRNYYPEHIKAVFDGKLLQFDHGFMIILAGVCTAGLWLFLNRTLKFASASYMTLMSNVVSVIVTVLAILFLNETLTLIQLVGGILIVGASFIVQYLRIGKD